MDIIFEFDDYDVIVEFEPDWMRENFSDHTKTKWVFGRSNQGSMGGMCHVNKEDNPKYITYIGTVRM
ncbi:MAG: hypothetical protein Unbinned2902contig1001_45 [Prokaryotic dsDNA virus sp.]|nr:MAG: hypothetical protein Unbinned2902contig1001_45 [Prokaryotic dsDNA virus sp.]